MPMVLTGRAFDPETTSLLGAAFDEAWQTVKTSGSPLADERHAASTREILAKRILVAGHQGERDINLLIEEALTFLTATNEGSAQHADRRVLSSAALSRCPIKS